MTEKLANTFNDGMNMDASDFVLQDSQLRYAKNIRFFNMEGSNYVISNLKGTDVKFQLSSGFVMAAAQEFNDVLYIISYNPTTHELEAGSYPSPAYSGTGSIWQYRPFNNFNHGTYRTTGYDLTEDPVIQKLEIQPDYDQSVNLCFTIKGHSPKIINSGFNYHIVNNLLEVLPERDGNSYTTDSLLEETTTILFTDKILKIAFGSISSGGRLKPGNYIYIFKYMSEDLNTTNVAGQSSVCQVAFGSYINARKGGDETQTTNLQVSLNLTNIDTNFKFLKVFVQYTAGQDSVYQQFLEINPPLEITGESMTFVHDGFEQTQEITSNEVNVAYPAVNSAGASAQADGIYFLANIGQRAIDLEPFRIASADLIPILGIKDISVTGTLPGYADPANVYNYMGGMGGESYPYGIVYILPGNTLSPVFPIHGVSFKDNVLPGAGHPQSPQSTENGIVTYPTIDKIPFISSSIVKSRYIKIKPGTVPQAIKDASIGFFFVRGERKTDLLAQGILIPTVKVPNTEGTVGFTVGTDEKQSWYWQYKEELYNPTFFKQLPIIDSILESYVMNVKDPGGDGDFPTSQEKTVIDRYGKIRDGYLPIYVKDMTTSGLGHNDPWVTNLGDAYQKSWALLCSDAMLSEPEAITLINRKTNVGVYQYAKINCKVTGQISPVPLHDWQDSAKSVGLFYDFESYVSYSSTIASTPKIGKEIVYVGAETLATGSDFISKIQATLFFRDLGSNRYAYFYVAQNYNPYFGLVMTDDLADADKGPTKPIGGNTRNGLNNQGSETAGVGYNNLNKIVPTGFLVNIYQSTTPGVPDQLYKTIDNVVYKQVTPRYSWSEVGVNTFIEIFGGDCYVGKMHRKMNNCPFRNPQELPDPYNEGNAFEGLQNINAGTMISWYQEAKYNMYLRQPGIVDLNEPGERSFFPYESQGNFVNYRRHRLPETAKHSLGYSKLLAPNEQFTVSSLTPYISNNFFTRIMHSERHVPSAFKNGYRSFMPSAFKDYDSSMGAIVALYGFRGNLLVIFEHGIGVAPIEQRVETANDLAGGVFIQPSDVLPPKLGIASAEIGCQHPKSIVQTPSAIYGVDVSKSVIWQFRDGLMGISDQGFASFVRINGLNNPRSGYDFDNKEVIFTTDAYTLCFKEGLEKFTSFYSFQADRYARRGKEFYSFLESTAHVHNQPHYRIYESFKDSIVEFVINKNLDAVKVLDWVTLVSNDIKPAKMEIYSYNEVTHKTEVLDFLITNQYAVVLNQVDPVTEEELMEYRDKKISIQIPEASHYNGTLSDDEWAAGGRMRNKYLIVRLTYNTDKPLQLASIISTFRYSYA